MHKIGMKLHFGKKYGYQIVPIYLFSILKIYRVAASDRRHRNET